MTRNRRWDSPWPSFPASTPIRVDGGLATRSQRGAIANAWWSARFVEVLESYGLGNRLQRGRSYARAGQVLTLDVSPGLVAAQVQGSRAVPYLVTLDTAIPNDRQWRVIDAALQARVGLAAHLIAGDVPADLEEVFAQAKAPLFPTRWRDLKARCTCPDSANPCKHIAAVLYLFADRLEQDPWLLLQWRGRSQDEVLAALGLADRDRDDGPVLPPWWPLRPGEPLPAHTEHAPGDTPGPADPPHAVLARLDEVPAEAWKAPILASLRPFYEAIARRIGG